MSLLGPFQNLGFANENQKDEEASDHVEATEDSEKNFQMKVAMFHVGVISM